MYLSVSFHASASGALCVASICVFWFVLLGIKSPGNKVTVLNVTLFLMIFIFLIFILKKLGKMNVEENVLKMPSK